MSARVQYVKTLPDGQRIVVADVACACGAATGVQWFDYGSPLECLCEECAAKAMAEDYGNIREIPSSPRPMRYVAAECGAGASSGRERKYIGSMGQGENANGFWDNLIRAYECSDA